MNDSQLKVLEKLLREDNERLTKEISRLEAKVQQVARLTDNDKLRLWIRKHDDLKKSYDLRMGSE